MGKYKAIVSGQYSWFLGNHLKGTKGGILSRIREALRFQLKRKPPKLRIERINGETWVWESHIFRNDDTGTMSICVIQEKGKEDV